MLHNCYPGFDKFVTLVVYNQGRNGIVEARMNDLMVVEQILRNRRQFFAELGAGYELRPKVRAMLVSGAVFSGPVRRRFWDRRTVWGRR